MAVILIVEDDKSTRLLTQARLKPFFQTVAVCDGSEALDVIYSQRIDLVVADVMMPNMDGYTLLKHLRSEKNNTPVLLLTAKQSFEDMREGFNSGTDDYMTKPVNYDELLLRINALLRRSNIASERRINLGQVIIDSESYTVRYPGGTIELPKKEFDLVYKLLSYPGMIFTKNQLLDDIWGFSSDSTEDTVKTHISRVRNRLRDIDAFEIVTVKGLGYKAEIRKA